MACSFQTLAYFIIVATASTLHAHGITQIQTAAQAAEALRPIAGGFAFLLFALGIIGTGLLAIPVLAGSAGHGHLKNEGEGTNGREEELGSSSYVNPDKAKDTQLVYALDFLRGVESLASGAAKKRAEDN